MGLLQGGGVGCLELTLLPVFPGDIAGQFLSGNPCYTVAMIRPSRNGESVEDKIAKLTKITPGRYPNGESYYHINGVDCISVTTVIDQGIAKNRHLMQWIIEHGKDGDEYKRERARIGTAVHQGAERIDAGETLRRSDFSIEEWKLLRGYVNFHAKYEPEVVAAEKTVYDLRERIAGTLDRIMRIEGKLHLVDLKTSNNVWPTNRVQAQEYAHLLDGMGIPVDSVDLLHLTPKTKQGFSFHREEPDPEYHSEVFVPAMKIAAFNREYRDGPELPEPLPATLSLNGTHAENGRRSTRA